MLRTACRYFFLAPMSVESALEQCDQLGHSFYLFRWMHCADKGSSKSVAVVSWQGATWPPGLPHLWQANVLMNSRWDKGALLEPACCLWLLHLKPVSLLPACREQSSDKVQVVYKRKNQVGRLMQAGCARAGLVDRLAQAWRV